MLQNKTRVFVFKIELYKMIQFDTLKRIRRMGEKIGVILIIQYRVKTFLVFESRR